MATTLANDPNSNDADSDVNKSDSDIYFKSDDFNSDDEYDHELHERLMRKEMVRLVMLEEKTLTEPKVNDDYFEKILMKAFEKNKPYFDDNPIPQPKKGMNEVKLDDENDSSNSEEEMSDDLDDDGYNGYSGYNEYGECDRGYYYRDGEYERKTSPMMSPIIFPVTA